jgi:hypothetical protein
MKPTNIMVWDECAQDRHGEEYRIWYVQLGDDEGEPIGTAYKHHNGDSALITAQNMSRDRRLPIEMGW